MDQGADAARDQLVLILAPTGRDGSLACQVLRDRAHLATYSCRDVPELCGQILRGAGAAIIAEEAMDDDSARQIINTLAGQLPWSDLPVIILAQSADDMVRANPEPLAALRQRGNVTVLDRPLRIVTLVTTVQAALRARARQYEVRDLLEETRNAVKQRDQFLAMLGHELRNPLATISNAMSVVEASRESSDPLEIEQRDIVRRQTDHLARLVDDLLDVSRITSGKITLQKRTSDLCEIAKSAAKAIEPAAIKQQHTLNVAINCQPVFIDADPVRIEQVINNLLTNAIKYTPAGGNITIDVHGDNGRAVLRVCDNGMGISSDLLPRVFELFTQSERSLDRSQGGLGIGLTLVRAMVEMHGGTITARSDGPGCGSEFLVIFPQIAAPAKSAQSKPHKPQLMPTARQILLIEDQADARRALQRLLQIWGHHVDVAEDGLRGVQSALAKKPDVALIDVGLPGIDGYEVARRLRTAYNSSVRLIALTGYGQPDDRDRAFEAGFDLHLVKPVDRDQLSAALNGDVEQNANQIVMPLSLLNPRSSNQTVS